MKAKKYLTYSMVLALCCCLLSACSGESSGDESASTPQETSTSGEATILCDESVYHLLQPTFALFDSTYPQARVSVKPVNARSAMQELLAGSSRGIIIARDYLADEDSLMQAYDVETHGGQIFAQDALVFYTQQNFAIDTIARIQLVESLLSAEPVLKKYFPGLESEPVYVCPEVNSSVYGNILLRVTSGAAPQAAIDFVANQDSAIARVRSNGNAIGIGYLSRIEREDDLRMLRIGFADSSGRYIYPKLVHQSRIVAGFYPFPIAIRGRLLQNIQNLPWGFFVFIALDPNTQRHFLDAGIVPEHARFVLKFPE